KIIFNTLSGLQPGAGGEIQLTDAIKALLASGHPTIAYLMQGKHFDLGSPAGFLEANIYLAANSPLYKSLIKNLYNCLD
ncbi:MAG TPA: UTP--glucose-1-phosphate uridylyltransferase, partial [Candidatus Bathyarchaeia archaeon]|nr:UTP--glucose-1-phosphate uridylyltransferase [Candidatus Bathyarchaeia archaeon]